jgi:glycosyltransferase involved in cell wall biosynthesis
MAPDAMVSVLVVVGEGTLDTCGAIGAALPCLARACRQHEIILVDNGTEDGAQESALAAVDRFPNVRYIRLTRRHPEDVARICAMEQAVGDIAVTYDPVVDAPESLPVLVNAASAGTVAVARRQGRQGMVRTVAASIFYAVLRQVVGRKFRSDEGGQRAWPRPVLNAITKIRNKRRNLRVAGALVGFRSMVVDVPPGPGFRTESLAAAVARNLDSLFTNSLLPLRWVSLLGVLAATLNLIYLGYVGLVAFFKPDVAQGWATLSAMSTIMFFLVFLILSVIAEYIGRIMEEVQERPLYFIEMEREGSVKVGQGIVNVV